MRKMLFLTAALAALSTQGAQDSARIQWKPKAGDTATYSIQVAVSMQGMNVEIGLRSTSKVLELTADTVKLEVTQQMVELKQNGENMADLIPPNTSKTIYTVRRDGEIFLLCTTYGQGMEQPRLEEVFRFIYPNREVKLGETWTRTRTADKDKGTLASKTMFTFLGSEDLDGAPTHKVKMSFTETEGSTPMTFEATVWLSSENGDMLKMDGLLRNVPFDPTMPPADATIKVSRVK